MQSWERLRVLLAVVETGTVNAAAERLKVSPSAVSQLLRRLEQDVGRPLVRRTPRQMEPTTEGLALAERARMIEAILADCAAMFSPTPARPDFMLGVSADLAATLLPSALAALDPAPGAPRIALRIHDSATLEEMFARGELDGAVVRRKPGRVTGRDLLLWEESLVWATAPRPD
jgi:DNA-binding transcriptional LysR family regulator